MSPKEVRSIDCAGGLKIFNHSITSVLNKGLLEIQTSNFWERDLIELYLLGFYGPFVFFLGSMYDLSNKIVTRPKHLPTTTLEVCFSS